MTDPMNTSQSRLAPLCFIDTETTGVHPKREAWEVALIRRDYDGDAPGTYTQTEIDFFVDVDLDKADPFGLNVGRFYERHPMGRWLASGAPENGSDKWPPRSVQDQMELPSVAARTIARMTHGAHLVGVVPNFDAEVFSRLLRRHGLLPGWHYHLIDVEAMAVGWLNAWASQPRRWVAGASPESGSLTAADFHPGALITIPDNASTGTLGTGLLAPPWRSDDLAKACGVEPPTDQERHTALGDARWAMRWFDTITTGAAA